MNRITIEIDGHGQADRLGAPFDVRSAKGLGLLSSFTLTPAMIGAIKEGYGAAHKEKDEAATKDNAKDKAGDLITNKHCDVIATIGGLYLNKALSSLRAPFVSLVGMIPGTLPSFCAGGVSLETVASNGDRRALLLSRGIAEANIYLYQDMLQADQNAVRTAEQNEWDTNFHYPTQRKESRARDFNDDLNVAHLIPANVEGLIISASPYFQKEKDALVPAINEWLKHAPANKTRYVVYPLQIYNEAIPAPMNQASGKNILFGPDITEACRLLGLFASVAAESNGSAPRWFMPVRNIWKEVTA